MSEAKYTAADCGKSIRLGRFVFQLEDDGSRHGPRNRWSLQVDGGPETPVEELEKLAQQIVALPDLIAACRAALRLPNLSIYAEESSSSHFHSARKAKEYHDKMNAVLEEVKAAIAKAEGTT